MKQIFLLQLTVQAYTYGYFHKKFIRNRARKSMRIQFKKFFIYLFVLFCINAYEKEQTAERMGLKWVCFVISVRKQPEERAVQ